MAGIGRAVSPIGFGAFKIGRTEGAKYPLPYDLPDFDQAARLLDGLLDLGIRYLDTAPAYGVSEERIGRAIGHRRAEFLLSTKVGETYDNGRSTFDFSERAVRESLDRSRARLRADTLDLVFVHAQHDDVDVLIHSDVVSTLRKKREEGVVAAIGLSGYTEPAFRLGLEWADALMIEYHPLDRSLEPVIAEAARRGVAVMVKKPLASGRLDPEQAIEFILSNPGVTSVVVGSLNLDHLAEAARIARRVRPFAEQASGCGGAAEEL